MSSKTAIHWTDETWNPTTGCTRVSAGCDRCYAFALHDQRHIAWKRGRMPNAPAQYHLPFSRVQLLPERLGDPLRWRSPRRVFVNSMSDLFHVQVPDAYIAQVWETMRRATRHTFQVLTKRPERMREWTSRYCPEPLPNVWLGTSVEHQAAAHARIPHLIETPAAVRFLSCEPLLGPVDLDVYWRDAAEGDGWYETWLSWLDWVIVGGESGPHYRPMQFDWARSLREQCQTARVAFFFKQSSGLRPGMGRELDGQRWEEYPVARGA